MNSYNEKYRMTENITWDNLEVWMDFFYNIGEFVENQKNINLYISYIDDIYPSIFLAKGIIDCYLEKLSYDIPPIEEELVTGDIILYKEGNKWLKAKVLNVFNHSIFTETYRNPYISLEFDSRIKSDNITKQTPKSKWEGNIKLNANYKSTSGRAVKINNNISNYFSEKYGQGVVDYITSTNKILVNIVGHNISEKLKNDMELLEFETHNYAYNLNEIFYFDDEEYSYHNVKMIKSKQQKNIQNDESVSIFVGDNASVTMSNSITNRNIFISNRRNRNTMREILLSNINNAPQRNKNEELTNFIKKRNLKVPKGVEIYAY
ncbi:hypothetical protein [Staphylococcus simulans]|uniref:hypothetical protein n=2 Tax=Staphylococcus simulans TaxID=1286 RepID=UPI003133480D